MKTINLPAMGRVTMEEVNGLLLWLAKQSTTEVSMNRIEKIPPMRTSELKPALKILEQFGSITVKETRISITIQGLEYLRSDGSTKKGIVRSALEKIEWIQSLLSRLNSSSSGRLPKSAINEAINARARVPVAESEVLGFIGWAEACELFIFDDKKNEIIRLESRTPRDPRPVTPHLPLAS